MNESEQEKQDVVAQWSFDTRPILGRFHLWLEDVEVEWTRGERVLEFTRNLSFLDGRMERLLAMTGAVTAIGTQVFGHPGAGGCLGFADPDARLGFGYVTTRMKLEVAGDERQKALIDATYACLRRAS